MTPAPPTHHRHHARHSRWLSAGSAPARIAPTNSHVIAPLILSRNMRAARSLLHARPSRAQSCYPRAPRSNRLKPGNAPKSP
jgi:hypothetical protein